MSILIIKMGALGDLIMATPVLRNILAHHADEPVWLLTAPAYAGLFADWPGLGIKALPRKGAGAMLQTLIWMRRSGFKRLYDLQSSERTAMLCLLSGIRERVGNHPGPAYTLHPRDRYTGQCHALERLNQILLSAGLPAASGMPWLPVNESARQTVRDWLAKQGLSHHPFVLMHAGASARHAAKRWPYFAELAREMKQRGFETVWLGGPDDRELNARLSGVTGIDATSQFTINEETELGRHARFAVTNDSAPMHILSCSDIPVFGLFGPTDWVRTHAVGQRDNVITAEPSPFADDRKFLPLSMDTISIQKVLDQLIQAGVLDPGNAGL